MFAPEVYGGVWGNCSGANIVYKVLRINCNYSEFRGLSCYSKTIEYRNKFSFFLRLHILSFSLEMIIVCFIY